MHFTSGCTRWFGMASGCVCAPGDLSNFRSVCLLREITPREWSHFELVVIWIARNAYPNGWTTMLVHPRTVASFHHHGRPIGITGVRLAWLDKNAREEAGAGLRIVHGRRWCGSPPASRPVGRQPGPVDNEGQAVDDVLVHDVGDDEGFESNAPAHVRHHECTTVIQPGRGAPRSAPWAKNSANQPARPAKTHSALPTARGCRR